MGADAVPVLPKRKKPETSVGGGVEVIESSDDAADLVMDEEDVLFWADDGLGGVAGLFMDDEEDSGSAEGNWHRCKEAVAEEEGTPVAAGGSDVGVEEPMNVDGEGGGGDVVEPVQIFSSKMDEIVAWFYVRRGRNAHACLSASEGGAAKALPLCNRRKRPSAADRALPIAVCP